MGICETCGNSYSKSFEVNMKGEKHVFDSFECAIARLAPICQHCNMRIIGHGIEVGNSIYCCNHCAKEEGA